MNNYLSEIKPDKTPYRISIYNIYPCSNGSWVTASQSELTGCIVPGQGSTSMSYEYKLFRQFDNVDYEWENNIIHIFGIDPNGKKLDQRFDSEKFHIRIKSKEEIRKEELEAEERARRIQSMIDSQRIGSHTTEERNTNAIKFALFLVFLFSLLFIIQSW